VKFSVLPELKERYPVRIKINLKNGGSYVSPFWPPRASPENPPTDKELIEEAVRNADVIYTDVWASMGKEKEHEERVKIMQPYQVNAELVKSAKEDYLFMHCLPAHQGEEVANSRNSVIFDQEENRMHAQKALTALTM
jgi:ornithine carbamoyltransferase